MCEGSGTERSPCIKILLQCSPWVPISPPQIPMPATVSFPLLFSLHLCFHSLLLLQLFSSSVPISSRSSNRRVNTCCSLPVTVYPLLSHHDYSQSLPACSELPQFGQLHSYPVLIISINKAQQSSMINPCSYTKGTIGTYVKMELHLNYQEHSLFLTH